MAESWLVVLSLERAVNAEMGRRRRAVLIDLRQAMRAGRDESGFVIRRKLSYSGFSGAGEIGFRSDGTLILARGNVGLLKASVLTGLSS